jgi:hypothetical protein
MRSCPILINLAFLVPGLAPGQVFSLDTMDGLKTRQVKEASGATINEDPPVLLLLKDLESGAIEAEISGKSGGRTEDHVRRNHSAQYISHPAWTWSRLRTEEPNKYESYVDLCPVNGPALVLKWMA